MSRMTAEMVERAAALYEGGAHVTHIARFFGVSASTISRRLMLLGVRTPEKVRDKQPYVRGGRVIRPFTADEDRRLEELRARQMPVDQIAEALGRKSSAITMRLERLAAEEM